MFPEYITTNLWRCSWCHSYCHRKWTQRNEFKSCIKLIAFHIALITLGKVRIQLFSFQLWVNCGADWVFSLGYVTSQGEGKLYSKLLSSAYKIDLGSHPAHVEGFVNINNKFIAIYTEGVCRYYPFTWPSKSRATSLNLYTAALWGYGVKPWGTAGSNER